jgi:HlyD family secretion protein
MPDILQENSQTEASPEMGLRSDALNELLYRKTGFLTKWALPVFVIILGLIVAGSWFIHYPDIVISRATIIAANVPKEIVTREEGRLVKLFVTNGQPVTTGTVIGYTESNASHEQVLSLYAKLDSTLNELQTNDTTDVALRFKEQIHSLGELQQSYQQFMTAYQQFADYIGNGYYIRKRRMLSGDLDYLKRNKEIMQEQKSLLQKDLQLSEENYAANEKLAREKVISKLDERNEQSKLLSKQLTIPQINANLLSNETLQREKNKEIAELEHTIAQQKILFQQQVLTIRSAVQEWVKKYIITSPSDGNINFLLPLQENSYFPANKLLGYVNPSTTAYYAEANLPQNNFGKVAEGQLVQLRFDAYPYAEFGTVNGKLDYITGFATDSGFLAHIQLPNGLFTSQHKEILYRNGLKAEARIITKDMRLPERLLNNIRALLEQ